MFSFLIQSLAFSAAESAWAAGEGINYRMIQFWALGGIFLKYIMYRCAVYNMHMIRSERYQPIRRAAEAKARVEEAAGHSSLTKEKPEMRRIELSLIEAAFFLGISRQTLSLLAEQGVMFVLTPIKKKYVFSIVLPQAFDCGKDVTRTKKAYQKILEKIEK
mgnify:CR=1 FL=1